MLGARTFCSKLVLELMCESGMIGPDTVPAEASRLVTPSGLFRLLQRRQCVAEPLSAISFVLEHAGGKDCATTADDAGSAKMGSSSLCANMCAPLLLHVCANMCAPTCVRPCSCTRARTPLHASMSVGSKGKYSQPETL